MNVFYKRSLNEENMINLEIRGIFYLYRYYESELIEKKI